MDPKTLLKLAACFVLIASLTACTGETATPAPLPSPTATETIQPTGTPTLEAPPTYTPTLHMLEDGEINILDHEPTSEEIAAFSQEIIVKNSDMVPATDSYNTVGDPIKTDYEKYPFYYTEMNPDSMRLGGIVQNPDGTFIVFIAGYNFNYPESKVVFPLKIGQNIINQYPELKDNPQLLIDLFSDPNKYNVRLTLAIAPDVYFTPGTTLTPEEIAQLQEEYKDVLEQMESRMITDEDGVQQDALKMFLKYNPELANNPNWTDEKMQQYIEIINSTLVPVVDMTWTE